MVFALIICAGIATGAGRVISRPTRAGRFLGRLFVLLALFIGVTYGNGIG